MPALRGPYYASRAYREDEPEVEAEPQAEVESEFPKHTGGGWYELSNGDKVRGEEEAEAEEANLS